MGLNPTSAGHPNWGFPALLSFVSKSDAIPQMPRKIICKFLSFRHSFIRYLIKHISFAIVLFIMLILSFVCWQLSCVHKVYFRKSFPSLLRYFTSEKWGFFCTTALPLRNASNNHCTSGRCRMRNKTCFIKYNFLCWEFLLLPLCVWMNEWQTERCHVCVCKFIGDGISSSFFFF